MIADLIRQAAAQLREAGIETPEHDAKLLLAEAVRFSFSCFNTEAEIDTAIQAMHEIAE